jgi:hypothetical protein
MNGYGGNDGAGIFMLFLGYYLAFLAVVFLIGVVIYVLNGFAFMRLYRKVGIEPWTAWVPYFNRWRLFELGGQVGWFVLLGLIPSVGGVVVLVFTAIACYRIGIAFRKPGGYVVLAIFLPFVWAFIMGSDHEVYQPELLRQFGYGPPLVGHGSPRGPYYPTHPMPGPPTGAPQ